MDGFSRAFRFPQAREEGAAWWLLFAWRRCLLRVTWSPDRGVSLAMEVLALEVPQAADTTGDVVAQRFQQFLETYVTRSLARGILTRADTTMLICIDGVLACV